MLQMIRAKIHYLIAAFILRGHAKQYKNKSAKKCLLMANKARRQNLAPLSSPTCCARRPCQLHSSRVRKGNAFLHTVSAPAAYAGRTSPHRNHRQEPTGFHLDVIICYLDIKVPAGGASTESPPSRSYYAPTSRQGDDSTSQV